MFFIDMFGKITYYNDSFVRTFELEASRKKHFEADIFCRRLRMMFKISPAGEKIINAIQAPADLQFTGDPYAYGSSGIWVDKPIDNTDPTNGMAYNMILKRYMYFENPWFSTEGAEQYSLQSQNPFHITVSPYGNNGY